MFSFLKNLKDLNIKGSGKAERLDKEINELYTKLKEFYEVDSLEESKKLKLKSLIEENGYLPYPYIKALEELSPAEVLYGLEIKWKQNGVFSEQENAFSFENNKISPAQRADYRNGNWLKKEQHNIKLINLAGLGNGNNTQDTGKLIDWLRQVLILPSGLPEKGVLATTIYLIPFHPREFGCAYLPVSSEVSPLLEDKKITKNIGIDVKQQVQLFIKFAQLAGHCVIYDILPQTGRFSKMVLANPSIARWYDINVLISKIEKEVDKAFDIVKEEFDKEDAEIVRDIYKSTLKKGSNDLSEHYQAIYNRFDEIVAPKKKEFSDEMTKRNNQIEIHTRVKDITAELNGFSPSEKLTEENITRQSETIQTLIKENLWPAPGGAWCSAGTPVFDKMSETGDYPVFKHFDYKGNDVTHFANLDCQTPYYFVYLESGEYNKPVIDLYIEYLKKLQKDYNFDGFRVDHIDHIVDEVSEKDGVPISYRAPRNVLGRVNKELKESIPHFSTLAEYMLWDKYYKEYHADMAFDVLWGNDIISQFSKNPQSIVYDNQELEQFNIANPDTTYGNLSILKSYNNQDGEFRAIDQYPGQLGEDGALFKWFKYKFLPGGRNAQRPVMFIDGDESFTKTGIESVIGAEISMPRAKNYKFFNKFNAINDFALKNVLTREGEAEIVNQDDDGFVCWLISKDPLKESLLIVANYNAPTEKVTEDHGDGFSNTYIKEGQTVYDKTVQMPCDYSIVAEYVYKDSDKIGSSKFEEVKFAKSENSLHFGEIKPSEFKIYKVKK